MLIINMKDPPDCSHCPLLLSDGKCAVDKRPAAFSNKRTDCPIICELPERWSENDKQRIDR